MASINLLPKESLDKGSSAKSRQFFGVLTGFLTVVFVLIISLGAGLVFLSVQAAEELAATNAALKEDVFAIEGTEQKLILVKNRLGHIEQIVSERKTEENLGKQGLVIDRLPQEVELSSVMASGRESRFRLSIKSGNMMEQIFDMLGQIARDNQTLSSLVISEMTFNNIFGYVLEIEIL